jgi:hypothetical protein
MGDEGTPRAVAIGVTSAVGVPPTRVGKSFDINVPAVFITSIVVGNPYVVIVAEKGSPVYDKTDCITAVDTGPSCGGYEGAHITSTEFARFPTCDPVYVPDATHMTIALAVTGAPVGDVGELVGDVGDLVGDAVGDAVGDLVGDLVGDFVGDFVGDLVGDAVGDFEYIDGIRIQSKRLSVLQEFSVFDIHPLVTVLELPVLVC